MNQGVEDVFRPAPLQEGILLHSLRDDDTALFVSQLTCRLTGRTDHGALRRAFEAVVGHHAVLRSSFHAGTARHPVQVVHREARAPFTAHDVRQGPPDGLERLLREDRALGFRLDRSPLTRLACVTVDDDHDVLVWTYHHLLIDGWSAQLVLDDLLSAYEAQCRGITLRLPQRRPYRDFLAWRQRQAGSPALRGLTERLASTSGPTVLPSTGRPGGAPAGARLAEVRTTVPGDRLVRLRATAREAQITLSSLVQAAWGVTLSRYAAEPSVVFGTTVSVRPPELAGSDAMVGVLLNTLPTRVDADPARSVRELLSATHTQQVELQQAGHVALAEVASAAGRPAGQPLFETAVIVENYPTDLSGLRRQTIGVEDISYVQRNDLPLSVLVVEGDELQLIIARDNARYTADDAVLFLAQLELVLDGFAGGLDRRLGELPAVTAAERAAELERTPRAVPPDCGPRCPPHAVAGRAGTAPDLTAVSMDGRRLGFGELHDRSRRVADWLAGQGIGAGDTVAVWASPSPDTVIAALAVSVAGASLLALDPQDAEADWAHALVEGRPGALLTTNQVLSHLAVPGALPVLRLDGGLPELGASDSSAAARHDAQCRCAAEFAEVCGLDSHDVVLHLGPLGATWAAQALAALATGALLVLAPEETVSTGVPRQVADHRTTVLTGATPRTVRSWAAAGPPARTHTVRLLALDGEPLEDADTEHVTALFGAACELVGLYRPDGHPLPVAMHRGRTNDGRAGRVGRPSAGITLLVLDASGGPAPVGAPGTLFLGRGLGTVPRPTGDAARRLPDGSVERLSAAHPVERLVRAHPSVADAVLLPGAAEEAGGRTLLVTRRRRAENPHPRVESLVQDPSVEVVEVPVMPLTASGRVDLAALTAAPAAGRPDDGPKFPTTSEEKTIAGIFAGLLELPEDTITLHESFFVLGGSSLDALRMLTQVGEAFGVEVPLDSLFTAPTVAGLAASLSTAR
ncbi:condensation domain-containing protein [Streptomyces sp. NPDC050610]|uniref:condensation domain-containing protein n=1 Tax=Streptomyces sp. NPDC050610 TaxID=3157097 RepID=UPI00342B8324